MAEEHDPLQIFIPTYQSNDKLQLSSQAGTYVLVLRVNRLVQVPIGKLGCFSLQRGFYLYCGSAFGPGGVRSRVLRHIKQGKALRWHIDYLREQSELVEVWLTYHPEKLECSWAYLLSQQTGVTCPIAGFGSSDCRCSSHLFYIKRKPSRKLPLLQSALFLITNLA